MSGQSVNNVTARHYPFFNALTTTTSNLVKLIGA